jgi:predicted Rossmann-fold nucleotide-binding protein
MTAPRARGAGLPFDPLRHTLYGYRDLFDDFDLADPDSYASCSDTAILSYFVRYGKNPTRDSRAATLEALHDNSLSLATQRLLASGRKVIAVMGGHAMVRGTPPYNGVAHMAHELARRGFLLVSGGGPGAMEATHLGAAFSTQPIDHLDEALEELASQAALPPNAANLMGPRGQVDRGVARDLHRWLAPAMNIAERLGGARGESLGVPTWLYGFEPTTPFASHIAKYFQNSLREDGLIRYGTHGAIYAEGSAGTVQEIFQDAAQSFYGTVFVPMVFLSSPADPGQHFWESALPVRPLIEAMLGKNAGLKKILFTDSTPQAIEFLTDGQR